MPLKVLIQRRKVESMVAHSRGRYFAHRHLRSHGSKTLCHRHSSLWL
ncbi:unnamed protein product [Chondrus crispus]|uniref:Uncharacterized protein n=1 Tax=Chondrus crispus TaxID=2769 RepID=R7QI81_CHOCR|nr:unnamed protein product [Chondrus crispus]CDF37458.1 unnamed protein product [Chondrus crispus]|eukprot:XP_005717277.1 unnamed protein product [Chondrus crispus]